MLMTTDEEDSSAPSADGHDTSAEDGGPPSKRMRLQPTQATGWYLFSVGPTVRAEGHDTSFSVLASASAAGTGAANGSGAAAGEPLVNGKAEPVDAPEEAMPEVTVLDGGPEHRQVVLPAAVVGTPPLVYPSEAGLHANPC